MKYVSLSGPALEAAQSIHTVNSILLKTFFLKESGQQRDIAINAKP